MVKRMSARLRAAGERRGTLQRQIEGVRRWAAKEGIVLPGDSGIDMPPTVTVRGPPPGARDIFGRMAP